MSDWETLGFTAVGAAFLQRHVAGPGQLDPLPSDASARRYLRVREAGQLVMEDRSNPVGFAAFIRLAAHLHRLGLSVPQVYAQDDTLCLAVIEDFGLPTYGRLLARGYDERTLYALAIDVLLHLHAHPQATGVEAPVFDLETLVDEVSLFTQWMAPALRPDLDLTIFDAAFRAAWAAALEPIRDAPQTLVLRDFHIDNLMLLEDRAGVARCGILDFQDGLIGAVEYDLVSLLQDARRDLAEGLEEQMLARYFEGRTPKAQAAARQRYHLLGAQRHTRIAGVFVRLHQRDAKPGYLKFLPRVIGQMERALDDAGLVEIAALLDEALPNWRNAGALFQRG